MANPNGRRGTKLETDTSRFLSDETGQSVERRRLSGAHDRGDISGFYFGNDPVVIECKDVAENRFAEWIDEAETEARNAGSKWFYVVRKRRGKGIGKAYVLTTLCQLAQLANLIGWMKEKIDRLEAEVDVLKRMIYGK